MEEGKKYFLKPNKHEFIVYFFFFNFNVENSNVKFEFEQHYNAHILESFEPIKRVFKILNQNFSTTNENDENFEDKKNIIDSDEKNYYQKRMNQNLLNETKTKILFSLSTTDFSNIKAINNLHYSVQKSYKEENNTKKEKQSKPSSRLNQVSTNFFI